jgi:hypothetical protein
MDRSVVEPIARVGMAARGAVYVTVGVLAAAAAVGYGGRATGPDGAVRAIGRVDRTGVLLLAAGLVGYAIWRFAQAFYDLDGRGKSLRGLADRVGDVISGFGHLGLALTAAGYGLTRGDSALRASVARRLREPGGPWTVGLAGAVVIGIGLWQFWVAWHLKFEKHLRLRGMTASARRWSQRIGRFGLAARGVTLMVVGHFLIRAARYMNAREVRDLGGALRTLQQQRNGAWLLGIVALGLVAYGVQSFLDARYRRVLP